MRNECVNEGLDNASRNDKIAAMGRIPVGGL